MKTKELTTMEGVAIIERDILDDIKRQLTTPLSKTYEELLSNDKTCNCSFRIKLVGDGCHVCNPEYWEDMRNE